ncbi:hypothetical protein PTQ27_09165 [Mannheimia sp. AT1]|uniref:Uncharacterized protein n=1 Tax=Mannheimia cairinae TaxID=3025936 RepID=A0ABT5MR13_9PAST|nr:hypothetical protein [Mannheimia cairinae]MDD0824626.1 hypothetical protein [Mannheimia cairinae]MDD0826445.1 hypothetical protein [Mannheimia cairinae]
MTACYVDEIDFDEAKENRHEGGYLISGDNGFCVFGNEVREKPAVGGQKFSEYP